MSDINHMRAIASGAVGRKEINSVSSKYGLDMRIESIEQAIDSIKDFQSQLANAVYSLATQDVDIDGTCSRASHINPQHP